MSTDLTKPSATRALLWGVVLLVAAGVMAFLPLFGLLGYESSFVLALLGALASAHLGARTMHVARSSLAPSQRALADARPLAFLLERWLRETARRALLLLMPVALLTLNALRVRNCNLAGGFVWIAVMALPSLAAGTAAGMVAGLVARRSGRASLLAVAAVLVSVLWSLWRFYAAPPIFAFDPFGGFFPGSLYDEEVAVTRTLLIARALHLVFALGWLAAASRFLDGTGLRLRLAAARGRHTLGAGLLVLLALAGLVSEPSLGVAPDARSIASALGGRTETEHLILLYAPGGPWGKDIALYAADGEYRYAQLASGFGVHPEGPNRKVTCFLFDSAAEKKRFTGASHTQIAKPWRREIYLQFAGWPHPVIQHELAHVFAGEFGDRVFHIAWGALPNPGLVEGAAVAAERRAQPLTLDEEVKVMRRMGVAPSLAQVMSLSFLGLPAARAYPTAGSFCQFLVQRYGAAKFRALYASGGDFMAAYGVDLATLEREWSARVDAAVVAEDAGKRAAEPLRVPAVIHKRCAHELALREERAREREAAGDSEGAIAIIRSICADEPDDPGRIAELMDHYVAAKRDSDAARTAREVLAHAKADPSVKARALNLLGDQALRLDDPAAAGFYRDALALPLGEAAARQLRARLLATTDAPYAKALGRYLVGDGGARDGGLDLLRAEEVEAAAPASGIGGYLLGRQLAGHDRHTEAVSALERSLRLGLPDASFVVEARRLAALSALRTGDRDAARRQLTALIADEGTPPATRAESRDLFERCDWLAAHRQ